MVPIVNKYSKQISFNPKNSRKWPAQKPVQTRESRKLPNQTDILKQFEPKQLYAC
jgi:hypothetical protein